MIETVSLELCKKLYELSGWDNTLAGAKPRWIELLHGSWDLLSMHDLETNGLDKKLWYKGIPGYTLGFLLRKLPAILKLPNDHCQLHLVKDWFIGYKGYDLRKNVDTWHHKQIADTPEDAVALLAIILFEQKIIKKEK